LQPREGASTGSTARSPAAEGAVLDGIYFSSAASRRASLS
jgi:hypothetical protein